MGQIAGLVVGEMVLLLKLHEGETLVDFRGLQVAPSFPGQPITEASHLSRLADRGRHLDAVQPQAIREVGEGSAPLDFPQQNRPQGFHQSRLRNGHPGLLDFGLLEDGWKEAFRKLLVHRGLKSETGLQFTTDPAAFVAVAPTIDALPIEIQWRYQDMDMLVVAIGVGPRRPGTVPVAEAHEAVQDAGFPLLTLQVFSGWKGQNEMDDLVPKHGARLVDETKFPGQLFRLHARHVGADGQGSRLPDVATGIHGAAARDQLHDHDSSSP